MSGYQGKALKTRQEYALNVKAHIGINLERGRKTLSEKLRYPKREYNALSLFSGGGGLDLGAEAAGFTTRVCIDNDKACCETLETNKDFPRGSEKHFLAKAKILCRDIQHLSAKEILANANIEKSEIDLIYGGPPCQAFSIFGRRKGMEDPRGPLLLDYVRIVHDLQPKVFVLENVPGLETVGGGKIYNDLVDLLKKETNGGKFDVKPFVSDVCDYGVPQRRKRIIIIGSRLEVPITIPPSTHGPRENIGTYVGDILPYNTVGDALKGLPQVNSDKVPNHKTRTHSERIKQRYAQLAFGERDSKTRINKLDPNKPSFTIIVGSEHGGGKGHVHPYEAREVTPRESARIQTFPDDWSFSGSKRNVIRQVGNAVPPVFAAQLFAHILKKQFREKNVPDVDDLFRILGQEHLKH